MPKIKIIAVSDNRNEWGHHGLILTDGKYYYEASSYERRQIGEIDIPPYSLGFIGLNWAAVAIEAPMRITFKDDTPADDPPAEKKQEYCLYMYRITRKDEEHTIWNESLSMLRTSAQTRFGQLRGIVQHYQLFQIGKPDRWEIKPV